MPRYAPARFARRCAAVLVLALLAVLLPVCYSPAVGVSTAAVPYTGDFADPAVLRMGGTYYAYATNTGGRHLPLLTSTDLLSWRAPAGLDGNAADEAMPQPAVWGLNARSGVPGSEVWAPGVFAYRGRYIAFYALRLRAAPRRTCIAVATSSSATGPFVDRTVRPVVCDADPLGSIDPQPYVDPSSGLPYLVWKSEGQAGVSPTRLWTQRLDSSGTALLAGAPRRKLLQTLLAWEGNIIENPSMIKYASRWWLFYSANDWASPRYAIGYARCAGPLGPCSRAATRPLLATAGLRSGPGGASAFRDADGRLRLAYHYWPGTSTGYAAGPCPTGVTCDPQVRRLGVTMLHLDPSGHLALE